MDKQPLNIDEVVNDLTLFAPAAESLPKTSNTNDSNSVAAVEQDVESPAKMMKGPDQIRPSLDRILTQTKNSYLRKAPSVDILNVSERDAVSFVTEYLEFITKSIPLMGTTTDLKFYFYN